MDVKKVKKEDQFCLAEEIEKVAQKAEIEDVLEVNRFDKPTIFLLLVKGVSSKWAVVNLNSSILWRNGTIDLQETLEEYLKTSTYNEKTIKGLILHKAETVQLVIKESI